MNIINRYGCSKCNKPFFNLRDFINHINDEHPDQLKRYSLKNKMLNLRAIVYAKSEEDALKYMGWVKPHCSVNMLI